MYIITIYRDVCPRNSCMHKIKCQYYTGHTSMDPVLAAIFQMSDIDLQL